MRIAVRGAGVPLSRAIVQHVRDRVRAALDQHGARVHDVRVQLEDDNGPRGGRDQRCRVTVRLVSGQLLVHERTDRDLYANVSLAADMVKRRVGKVVDKLRCRRGR